MSRSLVRRIAPALFAAYVGLLRRTLRLRIRHRDRLLDARKDAGAVVLAVWHSRFALAPLSHLDAPLVALVSRHGDGRMLGEVFRRLGYALAFGSSTRGGAQGMREALRAAKEGSAIGIAPDGPRGPRRRAKPGAVALARLTGFPIVPVTFSANPAHRFDSWDRTLLPWPFARAEIAFGEPVRIPRDAGPDRQEAARRRLEAELDAITDEADRRVGLEPEPPRPPVEAAS